MQIYTVNVKRDAGVDGWAARLTQISMTIPHIDRPVLS